MANLCAELLWVSRQTKLDYITMRKYIYVYVCSYIYMYVCMHYIYVCVIGGGGREMQ